MNNKYYIGEKVSSFENYNDVGPITGVVLVIDDENEYRAGDKSGFVLEIECPYGTQTMANNLLTSVNGYTYKGFHAADSELDMLAELGDGITVNGIYSMLAYKNLTFGPGHMSEIAAPGESELEHEYPYISSTQKTINRKIAITRSLISKTAEEIRLEVENEIEGLSSSLSIQLDSITSRVDGLGGAYTELKVAVDGVTITDSSGTTRIKGSSIDTSTISANSIRADQVNLTGSITFGDLDSSTQNSINTATISAQNAQTIASGTQSTLTGWTYPGTTNINGTMIQTGTVRASILEGGQINLLNYAGDSAGSLTLEGAASYSGQKIVMTSGAIELRSMYGSTYLVSGDGVWLDLTDRASFGGDITPASDGSYSCGMSDRRWSDIYSHNATIQTSDLQMKSDVVYGLDDYELLFDKLQPLSFVFINGNSGRRHLGFGAQDVEQSLEECGISSMDFAGFIKTPVSDGKYNYALRYSEFIPLAIWQIQELKKRIIKLERKVM